MKRLFDIVTSATGLVLLSPVLIVVLVRIWLQDHHSPFYLGERASRGGGSFRMVKIRSMIVGADRSGVESTGTADTRITPLGHFIRRYKLDETTQLWNVLRGDMSLVGPRPNTLREVAKYTAAERGLLSVRPGITDIASIVFSDEGDIIKDAPDPDEAYDKLVRPWKSRLGLIYANNAGVILDIQLVFLTLLAIVNKQAALRGVRRILLMLNADQQVIDVAQRDRPLEPSLPPL
ncbi:sugar transferase [Shinella oryzae]|uniref:Sugar transferase n=1 Tax=Shinella oryzae TaxID=2871820 RepID=A0ABY9K1F8_9HYPH|nr:sugar transferase [Shinella oryzae]WLS01469.1 sugar transferase [Shinella oryzae]